jgi:hypothetical protein
VLRQLGRLGLSKDRVTGWQERERLVAQKQCKLRVAMLCLA